MKILLHIAVVAIIVYSCKTVLAGKGSTPVKPPENDANKGLYLYRILPAKENTFGFMIGTMRHDKTHEFFYPIANYPCIPEAVSMDGRQVGFRTKEDAEIMAQYITARWNNGMRDGNITQYVIDSLNLRIYYLNFDLLPKN